MTQIIFIRFEGGPLDAQHTLFERGQTGTWPPPRYAYFVRAGDALTVWSATEDGRKPAPLRGFKLARYRRVSCTVPENPAQHDEDEPVYGAMYRFDPTNDEKLSSVHP